MKFFVFLLLYGRFFVSKKCCDNFYYVNKIIDEMPAILNYKNYYIIFVLYGISAIFLLNITQFIDFLN